MSYKLKDKKTKNWSKRDGIIDIDNAYLQIKDRLGLSDPMARLLYCRGQKDAESARAFLRMEETMLHNPFLMKDMDRAVTIIFNAINEKKKICIYGDYDVDGVTSVSMLYLYLKSKGGDVCYYIPDRIGEGYGMSESAIEKMAKNNVGLIITVDTGITANDEIKHAHELGIDVIVTDHHECHGELPSALAVVNPKRTDDEYPFKNLAGVGVVFKLLCAYEFMITESNDKLSSVKKICSDYADLVALGTIADVMPVLDENRLIVSYGLKLIESNARLGLSCLIDASTQKAEPIGTYKRPQRRPRITSGFIGYTIAPRINAAGRIANASVAAELFLTDDLQKAEELSAKLCEINRFRQSEENKIAEEAYEKIELEHDFENDPVIVLEDNTWHHGVIGIVASRITEKYGLSSILISFDGQTTDDGLPNDIGKGSGRSIKGLNLVDALVHTQDLLVKFGGHELAAGLSIQRGNIDEFRKKINEYARSVIKGEGASLSTVEYDFEIDPKDVDMQFAEEIRLLEPYGISNPIPAFLLRDCKVCDIVPISGGKHTKIVVKKDDRCFVAMCFSRSQADLGIYVGDIIDLIANVDINDYNGNRTVQLIVKDLRISDSYIKRHNEDKLRYEAIISGGVIFEGEDVVPQRSDFVAFYNLIRREIRFGNDSYSIRALMSKLEQNDNPIPYIKLKFLLLIMREMNILGIDEIEHEYYVFKLHLNSNKTDLDKSNILKKLRTQQRKGQ